MRLEKLRSYIEEKGWKQEYTEEGGCGSHDFEHRGLSYHVWEFQEDGYGAESNVENVGRMKDYRGNYEEEILSIVKTWERGAGERNTKSKLSRSRSDIQLEYSGLLF